MSFFISRKAKKASQHKKNKYQQMIYEMVRLRREEAQRVQEEDARYQKKQPETKQEDDLVWSAKVGEVRNRLTGKKRASQDRWNRFAGTEGGGGRGL